MSSKKIESYLKVIAGAVVTFEKVPRGTGRILIKVWTPGGHNVIGLSFDSLDAIDSVMIALTRIREDQFGKTEIHPKMHDWSGGRVH